MNEENAPQKERYLREVEQKLLHRSWTQGCWTTV